jgi:tetratricopeptide (TPR) repeat protein
VATLDALAAVLAGQRRLEDAIGPCALLGPVSGQLDAITAMLRDATGPLTDRLGRIVAEWTVFAGWLYAALRQDDHALALFSRGENLADEYDDGTIAAIATSFRGYVARQQGRPRAVIRASQAAMASPGGDPVQRTFDQLQAAQGHAALGQVDQARRLLDAAAERTTDRFEPPPPVYWYSGPFFQLNIGMVHLEIGEHADAAALLDAGLHGMPSDQAGAEWLNEYRAARQRAQDLA